MDVYYQAEDVTIEIRKRVPKKSTIQGKANIKVSTSGVTLQVSGASGNNRREAEVVLTKEEFFELLAAAAKKGMIKLPSAELEKVGELLEQATEQLAKANQKLTDAGLPSK